LKLLFDHRRQAPTRRKPHVPASPQAPTSVIAALVGNRAFGRMLAQVDAVPGPAGVAHPALRDWLACRPDQASVPAVQLQKAKGPTKALQKRYGIVVESGDKPWSPHDLMDLDWALGKLQEPELAAIKGYRFLRWTTPEGRKEKDPTYKDSSGGECGLHEADIETGTFKISMYDACFYDITRTVGDKIVGKAAGDPFSGGALELLHEVGHAMAIREQRVLHQRYLDALNAQNAFSAKFSGVPLPQAQLANVEARSKALDAATEAAEQRWKDSVGRAERVLAKLRARPTKTGEPKPEISEYSKTSDAEMFAEAYKLFRSEPAVLQKLDPEVAQWFGKLAFLDTEAKARELAKEEEAAAGKEQPK
jgi:hypothetical protein